MEKLRRNKGITLVALVITIIILLILAGVSIQAITNVGLFNMAEKTKKESDNGQQKENKILSSYEEKIDEIVGSRESVTISKEEYETLRNSNSYSTTEKEVGTWIDGSKLYRVTINKTMNLNGRNWYEFDLGLSKYNIKQLVDVSYLSTSYNEVPNYLVSNVKGDMLRVFLSTGDISSANYVTLIYTKQNS